ncbi:MAG: hypothetical protein ACRDRS_06300 [Pseudonocardiaceae bacterium]
MRSLLAFCYDFLVGDDWTIAVGVVLALSLTTALTLTDITAWWLPPLAVLGMLALSLRRAIHRSR